MNYPRIYSLSTVGIVRHYIYDYLFHPLRTDFIGPNGVGKSIIADLLQLLFIYETDLIKFGTDGVKPKERNIHSLPYKTNIAYCFLNVEVQKGKFLIIGVAINSHLGTRLIPFVVTKLSDIEKPIDELLLSNNEILIAKDFLQSNSTIPDLKSLAFSLFQNKQLYLNTYKNKNEVNKYYQFLFDKNVLPINLSIEENLKAFAKVIQSFSKAKTLNLGHDNASRSLKEFLFEDSDTDLRVDYELQQYSLEKLLREYSDLDKYIRDLDQKQKALILLKEFQSISQVHRKEFQKSEIIELHFQERALSQKEEELRTLRQHSIQTGDLMKFKITKLPEIEKRINSMLMQAKKNYELQEQYLSKRDEIQKLEQEITDLKILSFPEISPSWENEIQQIDINARNTQTIKSLIQFANPLLLKYKDLQTIEAVRGNQQDLIDQITIEVSNQLSNAIKLKELLQSSTTESLIQWVVNQNKQLSFEQANVLLHYATMPVKKPQSPLVDTRYLDPNELFSKITSEHDSANVGMWLKLGALNEFLKFDEDVNLFENSIDFGKSVNILITKLETSINDAKGKLEEIKKVKNGRTYNRLVISHEFDLSLVEYTNIENLKEAVACILQLKEKISSLENTKEICAGDLLKIENEISVNIKGIDSSLLKKELDKVLDRLINRSQKFGVYKTKLEDKLNKAENDISHYSSELLAIATDIKIKQDQFNVLVSKYYTDFLENINLFDLEPLKVDLKTLDNSSKLAWKNYQNRYIQVCSQFDETKDNKNVAVEIEITKDTYSFKVIEEVLLGSKITHTDEISLALAEANTARLNMADNIKESMVKIFEKTVKRYKRYKELILSVNTFFKGRKISDRFYFNITFSENPTIKIDFIEDIGERLRSASKVGELAFDKPVSDFIEEFFKKTARLKEVISIDRLLNPKTYFDLFVKLTDENNNEIPGSTGEAYSAIALLGIARLSLVQKDQRRGLRFIILEEIGSLDNTNFNTFPAIAKEYDYQIITMAPKPFRTNIADEWFAHHLIKGNVDQNINFAPTASYFKTKDRSEDITLYLKAVKNELDRIESAP